VQNTSLVIKYNSS